MNDVVASRVRDVLARQAALVDPPARSIDELSTVALRRDPEPPRRPSRWLVGAATAAALVLGVLVVSRAADDDREIVQPLDVTTTVPEGPASSSEDPGGSQGATRDLRFATPEVSLEGNDVTVTIGERVFRPAGETVDLYPGDESQVGVHSDPGSSDYTTLELTWFEHGVEMRIFMYFASDGQDWWVTEIRTYDGNENADWIYAVGEFFRTPLGAAYEGDFEQGPLRMQGIHLRAFLAPGAGAADGQPPQATDAAP